MKRFLLATWNTLLIAVVKSTPSGDLSSQLSTTWLQTPLFARPQPLQDWIIVLQVGSQGPFDVVLDTGSTDLIVNGPACPQCLNTSLNTSNESSTFIVNASAGTTTAVYAGYGARTAYGVASVALEALPQVRDRPTMVTTELFNDLHPGKPVPTNGNPYVHADGVMGFAGKETSFCNLINPMTGRKANHCPAQPPYINDVLLSSDWAGESSFSMLLPPYDDSGTAPSQAGTLTLGARNPSGNGQDYCPACRLAPHAPAYSSSRRGDS